MVPQIPADKPNLKASATKKKTVTIGLIQTSVSENIAENLAKTAEKINKAAEKGAQVICLQELYRTTYFPQRQNQDVSCLAESIPGESTNLFSKIAKKHKIVIIAPLFEKAKNGKFYNTAVVIGSNGEISGTYRKAHIPQDPYFYEKDYFAAGDSGYAVFATPFARIGVLICYDQWFPEPARINTLKGAEVIFYPTAIGYVKGYTSEDGDWHDAWKTVQRAQAITNGVHVVAVNRVGEEGELHFWGGSFICDSFGKVLKEASNTKEEVMIAQIDLEKNKRIQDGWGFLRNRRPDIYKPLLDDYKRGIYNE
jgi:agmatine deiminase